MLKLANGKISEVFGPEFQGQDDYAVQVRLPEPPLLLCERVLAIDAEPKSMGLGTIWTEHTVTPDKWYLHFGRMPAGIFIECGQADLTLISYLGVDFHNRGERMYRLLGCEITWFGEVPKVGDTLKYEIRAIRNARFPILWSCFRFSFFPFVAGTSPLPHISYALFHNSVSLSLSCSAVRSCILLS